MGYVIRTTLKRFKSVTEWQMVQVWNLAELGGFRLSS
jgi:hypothetical protein